MRVVCLWLLIVGLLPLAVGDEFVSSRLSQATPAPQRSSNKKPAAGSTRTIEMTAEQEAAAMAFVKEHHPELAEILIHLKETSSRDFDRAVRDIRRAGERLAQIRARDARLYELELDLWKARSRAQLLGARLQMADDEDLRVELRETLSEEYDLRLEILARERDKFSEKVMSLENQIERLSKRRDDAIESQFQQLTKASRKSSVKAKASAGEALEKKSPARKSPARKSSAKKRNAANVDGET